MRADTKIKIITTDYNEKKFWEESEAVSSEAGCMNVLNLYPEITYQTVKGFGGAFTESSGYNYSKLPQEKKEEFIDAYFSEQGLKYRLGRTHMNSCDFALSNYAAVTDETDTEFKSFQIDRDRQYILPLIKDALKICGDELSFLLSPWSPPAFMKTNGDMNHGGTLKKEYYTSWAKYIARYIKEFQKEGLNIHYVTVQNEPEAVQTWDSCIYSAEEEMEFVRDHLGPVLEKEGLSDIKILIWDHNKEIIYDRAKTALSDEKAANYIYGIAVHWYTGDHFEGLQIVKELYPDKEIFFTEGCVEYSRFMDSDDIRKAEMYAHDMLGNFAHGLSAFYDWNLLLDAEGGPNHVKNYCAAPIMCNEDGTDFEKRLSYYYIGHFSRYVKAGAVRIAVTKYCHELEAVAFLGEDGERIVILLNRTDNSLPVLIREAGMGKELIVNAHSIITLCIPA